MNQISPIQAVTDAPVKHMTRRALAKQQTRAKVLAAARRLFSASGYEGATIRDIAAEAGMSTGAVFANFTDKSDLFREIVFADLDALMVDMREAATRGETVDAALTNLFVAGYAFYKSQMPLARAAFSVAWTADEGEALRSAPLLHSQFDLISDLLQGAVAKGELSKDAEIPLRTQMLHDAYISNFAAAIFGGVGIEDLETRARDQIRILLDGARRR